MLISSVACDLVTARATMLRIKPKPRFHPGRQLESTWFLASCHFKRLLSCRQLEAVHIMSHRQIWRCTTVYIRFLIEYCIKGRLIILKEFKGYPFRSFVVFRHSKEFLRKSGDGKVARGGLDWKWILTRQVLKGNRTPLSPNTTDNQCVTQQ